LKFILKTSNLHLAKGQTLCLGHARALHNDFSDSKQLGIPLDGKMQVSWIAV
jgi:hypothetical protein